MKVSVKDDTTESEAQAIAQALVSHFEDDVMVLTSDRGELVNAAYEPLVDGHSETPDSDSNVGPTEREELLRFERSWRHASHSTKVSRKIGRGKNRGQYSKQTVL